MKRMLTGAILAAVLVTGLDYVRYQPKLDEGAQQFAAVEEELAAAERERDDVEKSLKAQHEINEGYAEEVSRLKSQVKHLKSREPEVVVETVEKVVEVPVEVPVVETVTQEVEVPALVERYEDGSIVVNGEGYCIAGGLCDDDR